MAALDRLEDAYRGAYDPPETYATGEPLDGLILTLLSQNTNDRNRDMAYDRLREACPSWADVAALTDGEIEELIKPAGLGATKSARMKRLLGRVREDFGEYSLRAMLGWEAERAREYLTSIEGIGPKTAACVLVFDLGMPAFPVDTHVARVSRRLGWARENDPPERIEAFLEGVVPPERCGTGHLSVIAHGRAVCRARRPLCSDCPAADLCPSRESPGANSALK